MDEHVITLEGAEATHAVGVALGRTLPAGACVALMGDLGTGKTTLVRGIGAGLGVPDDAVASPTYTLMAAYDGGRLPLYHFDAWMEGREKALLSSGGDEFLAPEGAISVVEWAARVERWLPAPRIAVTLEHVTLGSRRLRLGLVEGGAGAAGDLAAGLRTAIAAALAAPGAAAAAAEPAGPNGPE